MINSKKKNKHSEDEAADGIVPQANYVYFTSEIYIIFS